MRIALLSPCGWGNLGDGAIQDAAIAGFRRHLGASTEFVGITLNPSDTAARHGIRAFPLSAAGSSHYLVVEPNGGEVDRAEDRTKQTPQTHRRLAASLGRSRVLGAPARWLRRFARELRHGARARKLVGTCDLLAISGGGQLDDFWGGAWGHPWSILKWALAARSKSRPIVFLSVGAGSIRGFWSSWFVRIALRLARYRSARDAQSLELVRAIGFDGACEIVPDLAFSVVVPQDPAPAGPRDRATVGLSPMSYLDPVDWPERDAAGHQDYLGRLARLGEALLCRGDDVVLFSTDGSDRRSVAALLARLRAGSAREGGTRLRVALPNSTREVLEVLQGLDVVVTSRLHGVILAQRVGKPVLALSHHWKVDRQMIDMDVPQYCRGILDFSPDEVASSVAELARDAARVSTQIRGRVVRFAACLEDQYAKAASFAINTGRRSAHS